MTSSSVRCKWRKCVVRISVSRWLCLAPLWDYLYFHSSLLIPDQSETLYPDWSRKAMLPVNHKWAAAAIVTVGDTWRGREQRGTGRFCLGFRALSRSLFTFIFTFTLTAFSRRFYPKRRTFVWRKWNNISLSISKDVHRTKSQTLTITRLTHSPYTTKIARIRRCYPSYLCCIFFVKAYPSYRS